MPDFAHAAASRLPVAHSKIRLFLYAAALSGRVRLSASENILARFSREPAFAHYARKRTRTSGGFSLPSPDANKLPAARVAFNRAGEDSLILASEIFER